MATVIFRIKTQKPPSQRLRGDCSGLDGTRTRDPLRDRQVF